MNTHQAYLKWIDDKILEHQTEIARLTVARQVLEEMPALRLEGQVKRQIEGHRKPKRQPTRSEIRAVQQHIINWIGANPSTKPIDMLNGLGIGSDKTARRPFYNAVSRLVQQGVLANENGRYSLIVSPGLNLS